MAIIYSPLEGTVFTYNINDNINQSFTAIDDETDPELQITVTNTTITVTNAPNLSTVGNTVNGILGAEMFEHWVSYIDKGYSDKNQTPIVVLIEEVPDNKEVFNINPYIPDWNFSIQVDYTWSDGSTSSVSYDCILLNDLIFLGTWVKDYFQNRY